MGGFPFGGGYFGLYSHATGVTPTPSNDDAAGHAARRRQPFPIFQTVEGYVDLTFGPFEVSLTGRVVDPVTGAVSLQLEEFLAGIMPTVPGSVSLQMEAFEAALSGLSIDPVTGTVTMNMPALEARAHGWYSDKNLPEDVRVLQALKSLPADRREALMRQLAAMWSDLEKN